MRRINPHCLAVFAVLVSNVLATTGWAQDADEQDEDGNDTATQVESAASDDDASAEPVIEDYASAEPTSEDYASAEPASEEIDVDDGSYIDAEEEDFRPSEDIDADQSITFPTDI